METEAMELLRELAKTLGTTTEYLWPELVRYQVVRGWLLIVVGIAVIDVMGIALWCERRVPSPERFMVQLLTTLFCTGLFVGLFSDGVARALCPVRYALEDIGKLLF